MLSKKLSSCRIALIVLNAVFLGLSAVGLIFLIFTTGKHLIRGYGGWYTPMRFVFRLVQMALYSLGIAAAQLMRKHLLTGYFVSGIIYVVLMAGNFINLLVDIAFLLRNEYPLPLTAYLTIVVVVLDFMAAAACTALSGTLVFKGFPQSYQAEQIVTVTSLEDGGVPSVVFEKTDVRNPN